MRSIQVTISIRRSSRVAQERRSKTFSWRRAKNDSMHADVVRGGAGPGVARSLGLRPRSTHFALMILLAVSIVASFQAVGALLVFGLLVGSPATASLLVRRVPVMMIVSILFGALAVAGGLVISFHAGTAGGATMAGLSLALFFMVLLITEVVRSLARRRPAHPGDDGLAA
jgi:ABC-type enterochelin transport system permease subunit